MKRLKVATIIGTRPEIIRLSEVIRACDRFFDHTLIHTGQNWDYTLNEIFFKDLGLRKPDYYLNCAGEHVGETMGNIIAKSYELLWELKPDALLILGDTNSALSAIPAKRLKIPIYHMESGNRCFDQNVPEEINRKIVDHISDVNLAYTEHSRRYLIAEGILANYIFVTGSPMREVLLKNADKIAKSNIVEELGLTPRQYFLVSAHREENIDNEQHFTSLMTALNGIAEKYKLPVVYSTHPRSLKCIQQRQFAFHPLVHSLKPFGFSSYNRLQQEAFCVLSDSGTLSEESAMLRFPAVLLRTSTERPEVLDKGLMVIGGITLDNVMQAIDFAVTKFDDYKNRPCVPDYSDVTVSEKVVTLIQSYTKIINEMIWRK